MSWAGQRRAMYLGSALAALLIVVGVPFYLYIYEGPSCFDGKQNGGELDIDCGGSCERLCVSQVSEPTIRWSRSFEVTPGNYSAVAYVENPNPRAAALEASYTFSLFDEAGVLIAERSGMTFLLPNRVTPVFESGLSTGTRIPSRTFFAFEGEPMWIQAEDRSSELVVTDRILSHPETAPRLDATLENTTVSEFSDIEAVAVIFGTDGNAIAASKTFVELLPRRSSQHLVFTWPLPLPKRVEACKVPVDVALLLDVSGSMNDDSSNPPQPITDAKEAAAAFVNRLDVRDRSSFISFATEAKLVSPLTVSHNTVREAVLDTEIEAAEERGSTNIGDAIAAAQAELNSTRHNAEANKVAVLLTDGRANAPQEGAEESEEYARKFAQSAVESGIAFYTIGLGEDVKTAFLRDIAGSESRVFTAAASSDLDGIYREISAALCERGATVIDIIPKTKDAFLLHEMMR